MPGSKLCQRGEMIRGCAACGVLVAPELEWWLLISAVETGVAVGMVDDGVLGMPPRLWATLGLAGVEILLHLSTGGTAKAAVANRHRHEVSKSLDMAVARSGTCRERCV